MDIKDKIQGLIARNKDLGHFISSNRINETETIDEIVIHYVDKLDIWNLDSGLTNELAKFLQLADKSEIIKQFELGDIKELLKSSLLVQSYNLDTYLELGHFEYAVMDNIEAADKIC